MYVRDKLRFLVLFHSFEHLQFLQRRSIFCELMVSILNVKCATFCSMAFLGEKYLAEQTFSKRDVITNKVGNFMNMDDTGCYL